MNITFRKAKETDEVSVCLNDFEPYGGYESFLRNFCKTLGESFLDWSQGVESGVGHITYKRYRLPVIWTDFPFALSFDCPDCCVAEEIASKLREYQI